MLYLFLIYLKHDVFKANFYMKNLQMIQLKRMSLIIYVKMIFQFMHIVYIKNDHHPIVTYFILSIYIIIIIMLLLQSSSSFNTIMKFEL